MSDAIRDRIEHILAHHRLQYVEDAEQEGNGYPLLDALSMGSDDVALGRLEIELLADAIAGDLEELLPSPLPEPELGEGGAPNDVTGEVEEDICGLCGEPGADKIPHPVHWPGEAVPDGDLVHADCEQEECRRAHAALTDEQRRAFLGSIR